MTEREKLLAEIEEFLARTGMKPTNFGLAIGAGKGFIIQLRRGVKPGSEKIARVRRFMAGEKPVRTARVELGKIRADLWAQLRQEMSAETVAEYAELLTGGAELPALDVFFDDEIHWLADGFHRLEAAQRVGLADFLCNIRPGKLRDAALYAATANAKHGLKRTPADKRKAVARLLEDEEWSLWPDREIARRCAVGHPLVAQIRAEIRSGLSGISSRCERTVTRGGATYTMETGGINEDRREKSGPKAAARSVSPEPANIVARGEVSDKEFAAMLARVPVLGRDQRDWLRATLNQLDGPAT